MWKWAKEYPFYFTLIVVVLLLIIDNMVANIF